MKNSKAIDYQITKKQFDSILSTRKDDEAKKNPYQYVMVIINESYGLRGTVTHLVIIE
jgi:hypothetical protein